MKRSLPSLLALAAALVVMLGVAIVPAWRLESAVSASGLPALLPAAAPPLGPTARIGLMLLAGLFVGAPLWIGLLLLGGVRPARLPVGEDEALPPVVRRADAHPDAPPRPPVRAARDLGTPFLEPVEPELAEGEVTLPRDLDTPMAMFDPGALPEVPAAPPPALRALFRPPELLPEPQTEPAQPVAEEPATPPAPGIDELLDRLDRGLQRRRTLARTDDPNAPGLAATLGALRRMASGD